MPPDSCYLSPAEIEATGLADADMIRGWCSSGELPAINAAKSAKGAKPRWKIAESDLQEFLRRRSNRPASQPVKTSAARSRPKRSAGAIKFF